MNFNFKELRNYRYFGVGANRVNGQAVRNSSDTQKLKAIRRQELDLKMISMPVHSIVDHPQRIVAS
jgi:hypothetical protein